MAALLQNLAALLLLTAVLPFNLIVVMMALVWRGITVPGRSRPVASVPQRILITGGKMTKALQLARSFHRTGHTVVLVETHKYWLSGHRFSNAVDRFYTVPAPEKGADGYTQALLEIVQREKIDAFIPVSSPVASYYDAIAGEQLAAYCQVIHFAVGVTQLLDDKFQLCDKAEALGLAAPRVFLITQPEPILDFVFPADGSQYLLKSLRYDSVSRLDMTRLPFPGMAAYVKSLPISAENPWVMQEFITGQEYCTHTTVRHGKIRLHCCSESSPFQVNYAHVDKPEIYAWVEKFVGALNLTGQISFDFIQTSDGTVYPIECNPRTHSAITMLYNHPELADAYLSDRALQHATPITPLPGSRPTYWLYHELWRLTSVKNWSDFQQRLQTILRGTDALFQLEDPLPFLTVPHWQIALLLLDNLRKLKGWVKIDFNIGKLVEIGGD
ncbi:MAG: ATP-grasp enzyme [Cyanobacteria bacterium J06626_18]